MKINRKRILIVLFILGILLLFVKVSSKKNYQKVIFKEIKVLYGTIQTVISTTGTVEPQNRLEIKPPIAGRIEEILVKEGQKVKVGDVLALMSSTERAALLDAAHLQSKEELEYWTQVYKATPLIAPIDGEVIVRAVEPGQTVAATDAIIVLSDRLIVNAQADETDIGGIKVGQEAEISLDAYPEIKITGNVDHISYESEVVNNVTTYEVDILPDSIPDVFRSGMSANIDIISISKENTLIIPLAAVIEYQNENFVMVKQKSRKFIKQKVQLGIAGDENVEVISGLSPEDTISISVQKFSLGNTKSSASNPFMPNFRRDKK